MGSVGAINAYFPIVFPSTCVSFATGLISSEPVRGIVGCVIRNTSYMTMYIYSIDTKAGIAGSGAYYIITGY